MWSSLTSLSPAPFGEVAAFILAAFAKQHAHAVDTEPIELVDRAQHGQPLACVLFAAEPIASITPSSTLRLFTFTT